MEAPSRRRRRRPFPVMLRGLDDAAEGDDGVAGCDHRSGRRCETVAQREYAQAEACLGFKNGHTRSVELGTRGLRETEQRPFRGRKAQREETAGVERGTGIGRRRVRGRRERSTIGKILLDLGSQHRIELA